MQDYYLAMYKWSLIFLLSFFFPAVSQEPSEPFMDQLTRAQIWCEVVSQDVYELSMVRHKGISQSDFLETGKETFQGLGHRLRQRMNQEKQGIKMNFSMVAFCRLRAQVIVVKFNYTNTLEEGVMNVGRYVSI